MGRQLSVGEEPTLPPVPGRDHAALALLPVTVATPTADRTPLEHTYSMVVDGKPRRVSVTLKPGQEGLPTHGDGLVYLALLQLALQAGQHDRLEFTRSELLDVLAWYTNGANYDRLRTALERLHGLRIVVNASMIARDGREYRRSQDAAHLIDRYHIAEVAGAKCWCEWGGLVREAFYLGDFKRLDWELIQALGNPLTAQLYRVLDRVTLSGERTWSVGWRPLAGLLGMSAGGYARPARFRQKMEPHFERLIEHRVIEHVRYERGGRFTFQMRNYLRAELRRVLVRLGVYEEAARQLVAGHDEVAIMTQCDCLQHGSRPKPQSPGGYLVEAIREGYEPRYPEDEPEAFVALWSMLTEPEREAHHRAVVKLCGVGDSLFDTSPDPTAWAQETRAVARFLIAQGIDPTEV